MANGYYIWDGSGWLPSADIMTGVLIAPAATPPVKATVTASSIALNTYTIYPGDTTITLTGTVSPSAAGTFSFQYYVSSWVTFSTKTIAAGKASTTAVVNKNSSWRCIFNPSAPASFKASTSPSKQVKVVPRPVVPTRPTTPITIGASSNTQGVYKGNGAKRSDVSGDDCYYGYYSSANGDLRSVVIVAGSGSINSVPKGDIKSATLTVTNRHSYPNAGTTVRFVPITNTSIPGSYPTKPGGGFNVKVPKSGSVKVSIPLSIAQQFGAGGNAHGFAILAAVGGTNGYGYLSGDSIRVTFNRK